VSPLTPDDIRRAIVERVNAGEGRGNRYLDHLDGVLRGLLWALTGEDPGTYLTGDLARIFRLAGIPHRVEGSRVVFAEPGDEDWPADPLALETTIGTPVYPRAPALVGGGTLLERVARGMGRTVTETAEGFVIGPGTSDALVVETSADTPFVILPRSAVTISEPITPGPVVYGELVDGVFVADTELLVRLPEQVAPGAFVVGEVAPRPWLRDAVATAEPWTPPPGFVVLDEPGVFGRANEKAAYEAAAAELEGIDEHKAIARARWPGAHAESHRDRQRERVGVCYSWTILGTDLNVAPTGDTEAEAWAEAARRAGEAR
jgi:hypothetical protein